MITRFAPSPTGPLHLGHAYSAMLAHDMAIKSGGRFLLRIEDIDQSRSKQKWEDQIYDDLGWLGLSWDMPVLRQSERREFYQKALSQLDNLGVTYACECNRRDIATAASAPQEGAEPNIGPDGIIYPGTCREKALAKEGGVIRLNMSAALAQIDEPIMFSETGKNAGAFQATRETLIDHIGDVVLARRDMGTSYHLSVVIDDAAQEITDVVRGEDLFEATYIHVVIQKLLGLPTPVYHHHKLIRDENGKRLAKRDDARAIAKFRQDGLSPYDIRNLVEF